MRVTPATREAHRAAILEQAGQLFRRHGIAAVSVADVTRAAGLTHGAFYGHFDSKTDLAAAACRVSLASAAARWQERAARARARGHEPLEAIIRAYLSEEHRDAPETGCALSALGPEIARAEAPLSDALNEGSAGLEAVLAALLTERDADSPPAEHAAAAQGMLAVMTGGIVLARACRADPARSRAALDAAARLARRAANLPQPEPAPCSPT